MLPRAYYFGCIDRPGHYLWESRPQSTREPILGTRLQPGIRYISYSLADQPWGSAVDGGLCPGAPDLPEGVAKFQPEGVAKLHHRDGWTALAFWDRSVDARQNSCSVFLFEGHMEWEAVIFRSRELFPAVWARFTFDVVPASRATVP